MSGSIPEFSGTAGCPVVRVVALLMIPYAFVAACFPEHGLVPAAISSRRHVPPEQRFGTQIVGRLAEKLAARVVRFTATQVFGAPAGRPLGRGLGGPPAVELQPDGRLLASF